MIFDAFMFRNELDMLECRLTEFEDVDVQHVLVEARMTHQGQPKELYYGDNKSRFDKWNHRITHVVATELPTVEQDANPWARENMQRDCATFALQGAEPDDIVFLADVDEIPSQEALHAVPGPRHTLDMGILGFAVDWVHPLRHLTTVVLLVDDLRSPPSMIRDMRANWPVFANGGWHISWIGGQEAIAEKAEAFCHLELKDMIIEMNNRDELFGQGWTWWHNEEQQLVESVDTWPRYIREGRCPPEWFRSPARRAQ